MNDWLGEVLWEGGNDFEIYRMKGMLNIYGSENMHMLQVLHDYLLCICHDYSKTTSRINYCINISVLVWPTLFIIDPH